jgi:autotransporter-associated beta strand protein
MKIRPSMFVVASVCASVITLCHSATAQTWDGGSTANSNWSTPENWEGDQAPVPSTTTDLTFAGTTRLDSTYNLANGDDFRDLTFAAGAGAFAIFPDSGSKGIDWFGALTNHSTNLQTLGTNLYLQGGARSLNATAGSIRLAGELHNNGNALAITGTAGTAVDLDYGKTFTGNGGVNIQSGTFRLGGASFAGTPRAYAIAPGATLNIHGNTGVASGTTTLSGGGTLLVSGGTFANENPNSPVGSGRNITLSLGATGLIDIRPGSAMVNGGWANITWDANLASLRVDGTFNIWDGKTVTVDALTGSGLVNKTQGGGNVNLRVGANGGSGEFSGTLGASSNGGWTLIKVGSGIQTLSGTTDNDSGRASVEGGILVLAKQSSASAHALGTTAAVNGGILRLGGTGGDQIYDNVNVTVNSGTFDLNGLSETVKAVSGSGGQIRNDSPTQSVLTINHSTITNSGTISRDGSVDGNLRVVLVNSARKNTDVQTFAGTNTYTGGTLIDNGHLRVTSDAGLGAVPAAFDPQHLTLINGGVFQNNNSSPVIHANRGIYLGTGGGVFYAGWAGTQQFTINGAISGPGSLTKTDGAPLNLTAANSHTGDTIVTQGPFVLTGANGALTASANLRISGGTVRLHNTTDANADRLHNAMPVTMTGGTLEFLHGGTADIDYSETTGPLVVAGGTNLVRTDRAGIDRKSTLTVASISSTGGIVQFTGDALGDADLSNRVLFTNPPALTNGILPPWITANNSLATYDATRGVIPFYDFVQVMRTDDPAGTSVIANNPAAHVLITEGTGTPVNLTLWSPLATIASLIQSTQGGTAPATVNLAGGSLRLGAEGLLATQTGAGVLTLGTLENPGTLTAGGADDTPGAIWCYNQGTGTTVINAAIANNGTGAVELRSATGNLTLGGSSSNTFNGGLRIATGGSPDTRTILLAKTDGAKATGTGCAIHFGDSTGQSNLRMAASDQFGAGTVIHFNNQDGQWARFDLMGTNQTLAGLNGGTDSTFGGAVVQNRELNNTTDNRGTSVLTLDGAGSYLYHGHFRNSDNAWNDTGNPLALVWQGTGTQTFVGTAIDYTGPTTAKSGNLRFLNLDDLHSPALAIETGATVTFETVARNFNRFSATNITGDGTFVKTGPGILTTGNDTDQYARWNMSGGLIEVREGEFRADYQNQDFAWTNNNASLQVAAGAFASMVGGNHISVDALSGAGTVQNINNWGTGILTVGRAGGSGVFTGTLRDNGGPLALTKQGTGTQTLAGSNTHSGATTVAGGVLLVNGSLDAASAVTVEAGGTLGGTGTVAGTVTAPGTIAPGQSVGTLTLGPTTLSGTYACEISGAAADGLAAAGLDLTNATLTVTELTPGTAFPYVIATYTGTLAGGFASVTPGYTVDYSTPGVIRLGKEGAGYAGWAAVNAPGQNPAGDFDGDGVPNAVEYVLGGGKNTIDLAKLPAAATPDGDFVVRFNRAKASKTPDTSVVIEVGTTLASWPDGYLVGSDTASSAPEVTITPHPTDGDYEVVTLKVARGAAPAKFARLRVAIN